jgi:murein DD-endopeptidase MepM/ murein hydrolase activator NlpD
MMLAVVVGACLSLPSHHHVIDDFRAPACERCAGNRGLELATSPGGAVEAGANGVVTFAGAVGGRNYVVVRTSADPSLRLTYGRLSAIEVSTGQSVVRGQSLGRASEALFFGVRRGDTHLDPLRFVGRSGGDASISTPATPRFRITLGRPPAGRC